MMSWSERPGQYQMEEKVQAEDLTNKSATVVSPESYSKAVETRLDDAIADAKPVNRSADLVPLQLQYDKVKKQLKIVIAAAKVYHDAKLSMDMARLKVTKEFANMAEGSPVYEVLNGDCASLVSTHQMAFDTEKNNAMKYRQMIIDYLIAWEKTFTDRVEVGSVEVQKLHKILEHYEIKVAGLREKVAILEKKGKSPNAGLAQKLDRNLTKLEEAWKNHEKTASKVCNLIEEVTKHGWKDLYPVVLASMRFHQESAREESAIFSTLATVEEKLTAIFNGSKIPDLKEKSSRVTTGLPDFLPSVEQGTHQPVEDIVDENEKDEVVEILEDEVDEDEGHEIATSGSMDSSTDAVSLEHEGENQSKAQEAPPSPTGVMHPMSA